MSLGNLCCWRLAACACIGQAARWPRHWGEHTFRAGGEGHEGLRVMLVGVLRQRDPGQDEGRRILDSVPLHRRALAALAARLCTPGNTPQMLLKLCPKKQCPDSRQPCRQAQRHAHVRRPCSCTAGQTRSTRHCLCMHHQQVLLPTPPMCHSSSSAVMLPPLTCSTRPAPPLPGGIGDPSHRWFAP